MAKRRRLSRPRDAEVDAAASASAQHPAAGPNCVELLYPCRHVLLQHMDALTRESWRLTCRQAAADVYEATTRLAWGKPAEPVETRGPFELVMRALLAPYLDKPSQAPPRNLATLTKFPQLTDLVCSPAPSRLGGLHPGIKRLDLSHCRELTSYAPLRRCTALESLRLHAAKHDAVQHRLSSTLASVLKSLTTLRDLTLDHCMEGGGASDALSPAIASLTQLQHLSIRSQMSVEDAAALAPSIGRLRCLQSLCLPGANFGPDGMRSLAAHITNLGDLQQLNLRSTFFLAEGATALSTTLNALTRLTSLELGYCFIGEVGAAALATGQLSCLTSLRTLGLRANALAGEGMRALAPLFASSLSNLRSLELRDNYLASHGGCELPAVLEPLTCLTRLDLSDNPLSGHVMQRLQPVLTTRLTLLQDLGVAGAMLGEQGALALAGIVTGLAASLKRLDASGAFLGLTGIGGERLRTAAAAVPDLELLL